eukprot:Protomagalhaensia_sp_Gyna_25__4860@NODE_506_length_3248_cov_10_292615_g397_i0_p4_GENE_NODE_506_length_3248_cov_10_292615_g397_i0NODE_506_length_3248_cov_10_292615_g397_i0_p4_ORF_typecomplete_len146_score17_12_NODE_506_length_3248_cov_10_292615_g397_i07651202
MRVFGFLLPLCALSDGAQENPSALRFASVLVHRGLTTELRAFIFRYVYEKDVVTTTFADAALIAEGLWRVEQLGKSNLTLTDAEIWTDYIFAGICGEVTDYGLCSKIRDLAGLWLVRNKCPPESRILLECDPSRYRAIDAWKSPF